MDGKGRATDNAFIERLWRSVKYEKIYLYKPQEGYEAFMLLAEYFDYYNNKRRHSSIGDMKPVECFVKKTGLTHYNIPSNRAQKVELLSKQKGVEICKTLHNIF